MNEIDASEMYKIITSSGLKSIFNSFAHLFIIHLLYNEPPGLTCTMIYCSYKKNLIDHEVPEEISISRSHIADHLNDFETEGLLKKGAFKQYVLTDRGRAVFEFARKIALDISAISRQLQ